MKSENLNTHVLGRRSSSLTRSSMTINQCCPLSRRHQNCRLDPCSILDQRFRHIIDLHSLLRDQHRTGTYKFKVITKECHLIRPNGMAAADRVIAGPHASVLEHQPERSKNLDGKSMLGFPRRKKMNQTTLRKYSSGVTDMSNKAYVNLLRTI